MDYTREQAAIKPLQPHERLEVDRLISGLPASWHELSNLLGRLLQAHDAIAALLEAHHSTAVADVLSERQRQDNQWGGSEHDDTHADSHWMQFIGDQITKWAGPFKTGSPQESTRQRLIKIAALALAGIESIDRMTSQKEATRG